MNTNENNNTAENMNRVNNSTAAALVPDCVILASDDEYTREIDMMLGNLISTL